MNQVIYELQAPKARTGNGLGRISGDIGGQVSQKSV